MSAFARGSKFYVEYTDAVGKRRRESTTATTMKEAEALEREEKVRVERQKRGLEVHDRNPKRWTLLDAVKWWIEKIAAKQAQHASAKSQLMKHVTGDFALLPLEQVTSARVEEWLDELDGVVAPRTVNGLRALLMGVFTKAIRRGHFVGVNPVKGTEVREVAAPAPKILPVEAVRALLDSVVEEPWRTIIWIAAYTGARRSEIVNMSPALIDLERDTITLIKTKRKKTRLVPIHPDLKPILREALSAKLTMTIEEVHRSARYVREALKAAGIELPNNDDASFKVLRSTWTSRLVECGARLDLVRVMGWGAASRDVMETFYLRIGVEALRTELVKLSWPRSSTAKVVGIHRGESA